ncbi:hypothetical protein GRI33_06310 [Brucella sp. BO3]|uniref:hypothetical protein n=1 Tax=unclassified Brucella TaxID=2632610 RepID=UPI00084F9B68|nr:MULTISPECIES: hypothetical protein [unclassified Brucella]OEI83731.1 hypothetical protein BA060_07060 [Brucella sp. B13-0095]QMV26562.1 hypothetical protein GRI33_06310 [Brucella sp. BO3]
MRTGSNDKSLISDECFKAGQQIEAIRAIVTFALFQAENAEPSDFMRMQRQWEAMLRMIREKIDLVEECNGEAAFLASTCVPAEEAVH